MCAKDYFIDEYGRIFDLKKNPADGMDLAYYRSGAFKNFEEFEESETLEVETPEKED